MAEADAESFLSTFGRKCLGQGAQPPASESAALPYLPSQQALTAWPLLHPVALAIFLQALLSLILSPLSTSLTRLRHAAEDISRCGCRVLSSKQGAKGAAGR